MILNKKASSLGRNHHNCRVFVDPPPPPLIYRRTSPYGGFNENLWIFYKNFRFSVTNLRFPLISIESLRWKSMWKLRLNGSPMVLQWWRFPTRLKVYNLLILPSVGAGCGLVGLIIITVTAVLVLRKYSRFRAEQDILWEQG